MWLWPARPNRGERLRLPGALEKSKSGQMSRNEALEKLRQALEYIDGATYFERVNNTYYVKDGENYVLATEFNAGTAYYKYVEGDSSAKLGTVAVRNYFAHAITLKPFDPDQDFNAGNTTPHVNKIFGCFNTEDGTY